MFPSGWEEKNKSQHDQNILQIPKSTPLCVCMSWLIGVYNKKTSLASVYSNNHHRRPGKLHIIGRRRRRVDPGRLLSMWL